MGFCVQVCQSCSFEYFCDDESTQVSTIQSHKNTKAFVTFTEFHKNTRILITGQLLQGANVRGKDQPGSGDELYNYLFSNYNSKLVPIDETLEDAPPVNVTLDPLLRNFIQIVSYRFPSAIRCTNVAGRSESSHYRAIMARRGHFFRCFTRNTLSNSDMERRTPYVGSFALPRPHTLLRRTQCRLGSRRSHLRNVMFLRMYFKRFDFRSDWNWLSQFPTIGISCR